MVSGPHWCVIGGLNFVAPKQRRRNQKKIFGGEDEIILCETAGRRGEHLLNAPHLLIPVYIILRMPLIRTDSHSEFRISYITDLYYLDSLA